MKRLLVLSALTVAGLQGCGGGGPSGTSDLLPPISPEPPAPAPPPPAPPTTMAPAISFVPIAGKWSGIVTERQPCCGESDYRVEMTLADSAPHGAQIGTVAYQDLGCGGILRAMRRIGDVYEVEENITMGAGCVPVLAITLTHDPTAETLGYAFGATPSHGGRAVLERDE